MYVLPCFAFSYAHCCECWSVVGSVEAVVAIHEFVEFVEVLLADLNACLVATGRYTHQECVAEHLKGILPSVFVSWCDSLKGIFPRGFKKGCPFALYFT